MVKTRTELELRIEELINELNIEKELRKKIEMECEKFRDGLQNALVR